MLCLSALILLAIVGFSYRQWRQYSAANADAAHSTEIREAAGAVLSSMLDAETSQRGFLLTSADRYLEPYNRAVQTVPARLASLKAMLAPLQSEQSDLARLNSLVDRKF